MSDYISREAAIKAAEHAYGEWNLAMAAADGARQINLVYKRQELLKAVASVFEIVPAADVEPERNGRWEECDCVDVDEYGFGTRRTFKAGLRCSQCACVFKKELLWKRNYCPSCGAKMDLEDKNNDN